MVTRARFGIRVPLVAVLLGVVAFLPPIAGRAASDGHFCGAGVNAELTISVLCQEMPPFPVIQDIKIGVSQEGPETSPTVVTIGCAHVVQGEVSKGYLIRPATVYASASAAGIAGKRYLIKIVDSGLRSGGTPLTLDRAGVRSVTELSFDDGFCGASSVPTSTLIGNVYTRAN
ncbi:MAG: hypothetical protein WAT66_03965 [Actinomycetota bacterium]